MFRDFEVFLFADPRSVLACFGASLGHILPLQDRVEPLLVLEKVIVCKSLKVKSAKLSHMSLLIFDFRM